VAIVSKQKIEECSGKAKVGESLSGTRIHDDGVWWSRFFIKNRSNLTFSV